MKIMNFASCLSLAIAFMSSVAQASDAPELFCHGTEPFWNATVNSAEIKVNGSGFEPGISFAVSRTEDAVGYQTGFLTTYFSEKDLETGASTPLAVLTTNKCNDGMQDEIFPHEIILFAANRVYYGCCRPAPAPLKAPAPTPRPDNLAPGNGTGSLK